MQNLNFTVDADGIALIAIDLPDRSMNVITPGLTQELAAAVERVAAEVGIRGAVLTSAKAEGFVAGADIGFMAGLLEDGIDAPAGARLAEPLSLVLRRLEICGKPFAAAINGLALGGGLELALACHYRVLADAPKVAVGLPEVGLGLLPGGGGTQRLPRLIGIEKSLPLLLTGQQLRPAEALKLGVVHALAEPAQVVQAARQWLLASPKATQPWDEKGYRVPGGAGPTASHVSRTVTAATTLAAAQTQRNLPAPLAILSAVYEGAQLPMDGALAIERKYFGQLLASDVARNLMRTMFINKQRCDKLANRPAGVPKAKVTRLGVLGAGMMGAGIAYSAANVGIDVVLLDATQEQAERGKQYAQNTLDKAVSRGRSTPQKAAAVLARIHPTTDFAALAGCEFVIEAVFEQRGVKAEVTRKAAAAMAGDAVFGSNTSTLPITGLAEAFERPADFIGVHFFSPVERMPLLEIILGEKTSQATLARALDLAEQLRKTPIVVNDSRGFFTSRTFGTFIKEGVAMLQEGVLPALIENAARQAGMPVGPLAVVDEVSLEITLKVYDQWVADGAQPLHEPALSVNLMRKMVEELGRKGKAAGAGFFEYPADGKKRLWPGLAQLCPPQASQPDVEELKRRFLTIQALEGARCIDEGVVRDPADADIGSILGIGYPAWTGGVLSYIETVGLQRFVEQARDFAARLGPRYEPPADLLRRAAEQQAYHPPMAAAA
ncbi:3-hydroxyacyl-CoA dehydrogenase NAD-binding domain-containing protein [Variovorax guangxiensis]|uniref:3-hydroxyacyl-CoA dehydrogenase NAD-binding domain-containing protein n=1 Tax=Variovorax guangxiensis TaxID=1775474 RepID=UPI002861BAB1|nr:3-hydroxyacyl-CoA dehydrogenase NAD-binding domain-containing protein [Variovorax guangxiensis]MDR6861127.1 3-hydroxyacyl-CoA dehydrogenase/enoyl-CoA hydratase/3-hydroxybutyryl-CoA epimerase [Variovorax guangxiensis]